MNKLLKNRAESYVQRIKSLRRPANAGLIEVVGRGYLLAKRFSLTTFQTNLKRLNH